jgi:hypothetical protein
LPQAVGGESPTEAELVPGNGSSPMTMAESSKKPVHAMNTAKHCYIPLVIVSGPDHRRLTSPLKSPYLSH